MRYWLSIYCFDVIYWWVTEFMSTEQSNCFQIVLPQRHLLATSGKDIREKLSRTFVAASRIFYWKMYAIRTIENELKEKDKRRSKFGIYIKGSQIRPGESYGGKWTVKKKKWQWNKSVLVSVVFCEVLSAYDSLCVSCSVNR